MAAARKGRTTRSVVTFASAAAFIALVAGAAGNLDAIIGFGRTYLLPILEPKSTIDIAYGADPGETIDVAVASPADTTSVLDAAKVAGGGTHSFEVKANGVYRIVWQGAGIRAASADGIFAVAPKVRLRLDPGEAPETGRDRELRLVQIEGEKDIRAEPTVSAALLVSTGAAASTTQANAKPATTPALPEFDRAATIVGLFQTGTTDCSRLVFLSKRDISVGCFADTLQKAAGSSILDDLDGSDNGLSGIVEDDDAAVLRALQKAEVLYTHSASDAEMVAYARAVEHLTGTLDFWTAYDRRYLQFYGMAARYARGLGLVSERGVLLVLNEIYNSGLSRLNAARQDFTDKVAAAGPTVDEQTRITILSDALAAQRPSRFLNTELKRANAELLRSGKVTWQGIDYDLDALGVSLGPIADSQHLSIRRIGTWRTLPESAAASFDAIPEPPKTACDKVDEELRSLIVERLGIDAARVKPEANFIDDIGTDTQDVTELALAAGEHFGVDLGADANPPTVGAMEAAVSQAMDCHP